MGRVAMSAAGQMEPYGGGEVAVNDYTGAAGVGGTVLGKQGYLVTFLNSHCLTQRTRSTTVRRPGMGTGEG